MADDRIVIEIELEDGTVRKGFLNIEKAAQDAGKKAGDALDGPKSGLASLAKGAGIAIAAFAGFKAITKTMGLFAKSIRDAAAEADAVQGLNTALALSGQYSREASAQLQNFASDLEAVTNFSSDATLGVATLIQNLGKLEPDQLQRATKAALDLATTLKIDVNSAAQLVGRAAAGNVEALGRYGIRMEKTGDAARDFQAALTQLEKSFGGASEAVAKTTSGAFLQLQNNFGDMLKGLGRIVALSPAVVAVLNVMSQTFRKIGKAIKDAVGDRDILKPLLSDLVTISAFLTASLGPLLEATFRLSKALFDAIVTGAKVALTAVTGVFGLIEMAINKLVGTNYRLFQDATRELWDSTQVSANETADSMISAFTRTGEATSAVMDILADLKGAIDATNGSLIDMSESGIDNITQTANQGTTAVNRYRDAIVNGLGQMAAGAVQLLTNQLIRGKLALADFGKFILSALGDLAIQVGTMMITFGIGMLALKDLKPAQAILAGAALVAIGTVMKAIGGQDTGIDVSAGAGGIPTSPAFQEDVSPTDIEEERPTTQVAINIQGDVLDSRDTGMRIVDLIKEYTDRNGRTEVFA